MLARPPSSVRRRLARRTAGNALPILLILAALGLSTLIFFLFTRPALQSKSITGEGPPPAATAPAVTSINAPAAPSASPIPATPAPTPAPAAPDFGFARPIDLGKELLRSLAAGDFARAGHLASAANPDQAANARQILETIVKSLGAKPGAESQVELLGLVGNHTRLSLPLHLPNQQEPLRLQLDVERDSKMGWKIARLHLPKELASALNVVSSAIPPNAKGTIAISPPPTMERSTPQSSMAPASPSLFVVEDAPDALSFGSDFVRALLRHDFVRARQFVDEKKVTPERLIGLCIVFEEGQYELKPAKPLIITVANPEVSWVVAQVQSQTLQQSTEFGLELQRSGLDQPWKVVGLNLSEILSSFAASAAKTTGVPYTPIVNNPKGGESLALYFEYDQARLHPRARKQLEIIAGLLKSDASRKLQIAGHTDAKGTDSYNLSLSQARAETVKQQLAALGVAAEQIVTTGLGKAQPLSPNQKTDGSDDPEGRSQNRRAEIYLDF